MLKRALFVFLLGFVTAAAAWLWLRSAPLSSIARGGPGPPTVVLLHGYGSRAEDWLQFEPPSPVASGAPRPVSPAGLESTWQFPAGTRRLYPQGPWRGLGSHRGWWWLHLEAYMRDDALPDMSKANPGGIKVASRLVRELIQNEKQPLVLGGFSQGAMTSADIAFQTDQEMAGLILLSGTTVNEERWAEHFAGRRRLPILIAHGRRDPTLSFAIMERFQARLKAFGMDVTWVPFDGVHEIPPVVVDQVNAFVARVVGLQSTAGRE